MAWTNLVELPARIGSVACKEEPGRLYIFLGSL